MKEVNINKVFKQFLDYLEEDSPDILERLVAEAESFYGNTGDKERDLEPYPPDPEKETFIGLIREVYKPGVYMDAISVPKGYGVLWNPDTLAEKDDLKWCPKHSMWEVVDGAVGSKVSGFWLVIRRTGFRKITPIVGHGPDEYLVEEVSDDRE